jgi:hypothetical protein
MTAVAWTDDVMGPPEKPPPIEWDDGELPYIRHAEPDGASPIVWAADESAAISDAPYILESAAEIAEPLPPIEWLCAGLRLARGSMTIVGGYGYSRKTLYAQDLMLSIASGTRALGVYSVAAASALHIDCEQGHRITRDRYQRLARARGIDLRDAKLSVVTFPRFRMDDRNARDILRRLLEETEAGLVTIDSLRASLGGDVDENSSAIREYVDLVAQECKRVNAAGIYIHHARKPENGKSGGRYSLRGSGALFDAPDGIFLFHGEKGQPTTVDHEKDRLIGTELDSFGVDTEDVERDGDARWGLRLVHLDGEQLRSRDEAKQATKESAERQERIEAVRQYMSTLPNATWKGTRSDLAKRIGGRKQTVMAILGDLASTGRIVETVAGKKTEAIRWVR